MENRSSTSSLVVVHRTKLIKVFLEQPIHCILSQWKCWHNS